MKLLNSLYEIVSRTEAPVISFCLRLLPECFIYRAHFPGEPVTPGVCLIGMAVETAGAACGRDFELHEVVNAKFLKVVNPRETPRLLITLKRIETVENLTKIAADITSADGTTVFTRLSLLLA